MLLSRMWSSIIGFMTPAKQIKKAQTNGKVLLTINSFGPFLRATDLPKLRTGQSLQYTHLADMLGLFFGRPFATLNTQDLQRYLEITTKDTHITFAPAYSHILERIVKPLSLAKRHYCLGEYISCVAVSGIICEMLTILVWKISTITVHGKDMSEGEEEKLFGRNFEKLEQKRRLDILLTVKALTDSLYKKLDNVRDTRNKYLHAWQYDTKQQKGDAKRLVMATLSAFQEVTDMKLVVDKSGNQKVTINPRLHKFLEKSGGSAQ